MKFSVLITETLARVVIVEAETPYEAVEKVEQRYKASEIVLDSSDFVDVYIDINSVVS